MNSKTKLVLGILTALAMMTRSVFNSLKNNALRINLSSLVHIGSLPASYLAIRLTLTWARQMQR